MSHFLLIVLKDGQDLKTYGVKKVQTNMKFSFIICVVIAFACCDRVWADTRSLNELKYLEYLNDLDRRNVEFEYDLHKQWPFHITADNPDEEEDRTEHEEINPENLLKIKEIINMARAEKINRNRQNYHSSLLDRIENGYKHLKDTTDRANQLSQYLRYKTPSVQERLEEARMYPPEDDFMFNEDEVSDNKLFRDSDDFDLDDEEEPTELEPEKFYSITNPIVSSTNKESVPINFNNEEHIHEDNMHHAHEDYKFKEGEEFPHSIPFDEIPLADDPGEFGVGPADPRFYRDSMKLGDMVTQSPDVDELNVPKPHPTQKPKVELKSVLKEQQYENIPTSEELTHSRRVSLDGDVEVIPYKPDLPADTAGVYIIAVVAGISAAATVGLIAVGIGWYNLQKHMKNAEDTDYPSYGIVGPNKDYEKKERDDAGDRRLAQSAQMYHYQHQKQQIIAMGRNPQGHGSQSDTEEEEDEEGNYTVYECPGLASIEGPLEVKNPMFNDDQLATPSLTPSKSTNAEDTK